MRNLIAAGAAALMMLATVSFAQQSPDSGPYKVMNKARVGGAGGFDCFFADSVGRKLYIPRSGGTTSRVTVFDLDTLKPLGEIPDTMAIHAATVDPKSNHGFSSSKPVVMWDTNTLKTIKTIDVQGSPDEILFDPATERVFILSHSQPNATVINAKDGSIVGTMDFGGAPEQGASDGQGKLYFDLEDKDSIAVVDANTMKVTGHYDLGGKGGGPAGLALDAKNHILFATCHDPQTCVILNAEDGKIITTLPIGSGTDGAAFNPDTMEAFSSNRDGTLTVIKEKSPTDFEVEQNVKTMVGARTSTLDSKTGHVLVVATEQAPPASQPAGQAAAGRRGRRGRGQMVPDSFTILVVGK